MGCSKNCLFCTSWNTTFAFLYASEMNFRLAFPTYVCEVSLLCQGYNAYSRNGTEVTTRLATACICFTIIQLMESWPITLGPILLILLHINSLCYFGSVIVREYPIAIACWMTLCHYAFRSCFHSQYPILCSLQITPACNMPLMSIKNGGRVAIVNLQVHAINLFLIIFNIQKISTKYNPNSVYILNLPLIKCFSLHHYIDCTQTRNCHYFPLIKFESLEYMWFIWEFWLLLQYNGLKPIILNTNTFILFLGN